MKCPKCESTQTNKNGHHHGKQNYLCKQCGRHFIETYELRGYSDDAKKICLRMRANGMGYRAIERETGISHNTIINWVRDANHALLDDAKAEENAEVAPELHGLDQQQFLMSSKKKKWLTLDASTPSLLSPSKPLNESLST